MITAKMTSNGQVTVPIKYRKKRFVGSNIVGFEENDRGELVLQNIIINTSQNQPYSHKANQKTSQESIFGIWKDRKDDFTQQARVDLNTRHQNMYSEEV